MLLLCIYGDEKVKFLFAKIVWELCGMIDKYEILLTNCFILALFFIQNCYSRVFFQLSAEDKSFIFNTVK